MHPGNAVDSKHTSEKPMLRSKLPKTRQNFHKIPEDNEKTKASSKNLIHELAQLQIGGRPDVTDS